jgi:dUTP pyrophosphatase
METEQILIKYFENTAGQKITPIAAIEKGNAIDLRSAIDVDLKAGEFALIPLGVGMKLPSGYHAQVYPRSSTFKNWGILQVNSIGIIDESYCGDSDQWMMPVYATRDVHIPFDSRVCQFMIIKNQPEVEFVEVDQLDENSRGGFGSTGTK